MKFKPNLDSYIFALNLDSVEEDLNKIGEIHSGEISQLVGMWEGVKEFSYQIPSKDIDFDKWVGLWNECNQKAVLKISNKGILGNSCELLFAPDYQTRESIGRMVEVNSGPTMCKETKTFWDCLPEDKL